MTWSNVNIPISWSWWLYCKVNKMLGRSFRMGFYSAPKGEWIEFGVVDSRNRIVAKTALWPNDAINLIQNLQETMQRLVSQKHFSALSSEDGK